MPPLGSGKITDELVLMATDVVLRNLDTVDSLTADHLELSGDDIPIQELIERVRTFLLGKARRAQKDLVLSSPPTNGANEWTNHPVRR